MASPTQPGGLDTGRHASPSLDSRAREGSGTLEPSIMSQPHRMSAGEYMRTRLSTLRPPMNRIKNPIPLLRMLNGRQWAFFGVALAAWVSLETTN